MEKFGKFLITVWMIIVIVLAGSFWFSLSTLLMNQHSTVLFGLGLLSLVAAFLSTAFCIVFVIKNRHHNNENHPTLITNFSEHPEWCQSIKSVEQYEGVRLGEKYFTRQKKSDLIRVIHISEDGMCRCLLQNGASVTLHHSILRRSGIYSENIDTK